MSEQKVLRHLQAHGNVRLTKYGDIEVNNKNLVMELAGRLPLDDYDSCSFYGSVCITLIKNTAPELLVTDGDGNEVPYESN